MTAEKSLTSFLYWISGTDEDLVSTCKPRVQMIYTTLGMVFSLNFIFLSGAWIKIFSNYVGWLGFIPGILTSSLFVLGIDRLIAMRGRPLTGALERYDLLSGRSIWEIVIRIVISGVLSLMSTLTLQLTLAQDLIREQAQSEARQANAGLRQEYVDSIKSLSGPEFDLLKGEESTLLQQRIHTQKELEQVLIDEAKAGAAARVARQEQFAEEGGLYIEGRQRSVGCGPRCRAQRDIAEMNGALATTAREARERIEARIDTLERELLVVRTGISEAQRQHNQRLETVNQTIMADNRYVTEKAGLFSDATYFLRLFSDPQWALGVWMMALLTFFFLMSFELAAILALYLCPQTEYDVAKNDAIIREVERLVSIKGMEDIKADIAIHQAFTEGASKTFAQEVAQLEEKLLRAKLEDLNAQLRSKQAQNLATLEVRLPAAGLTTLEVQPSANSEIPAPEQADNAAKPGAA